MSDKKQLLKKGDVIDNSYTVQFFIEGDNFSSSYRVKDSLKKVKIVKLYNSSKLSQYQLVNGKLKEFEIVSSLSNKGIEKVITTGETTIGIEKFHYIVLEMISGETLNDKLKRAGPFSIYTAVTIILELLNAVEYLHRQDNAVIHNNINGKTVWANYTNEGEIPVLTGFEQARYFTDNGPTIDINQLDPFFVAPELFNGVFTTQSDLFSVGALFYYLIFGIPPWHVTIPPFQFTENKLKEKLFSKRNSPLVFGFIDGKEFNDEHLKGVLLKALSLDVDNRFKTAGEFVKALKREIQLEVPSNNQNTVFSNPKSLPGDVKEGMGFSQIAGMENLKELLYNDVIRALNERELYESYGITIPNGMLLYGPPGCGKTFIAEKFSEEVGFNFMQIKPSDLASIYVHGTQEKIGQLFKEAEMNAPSIIFIDELDALVPNREGDLQQSYASEVNEFLAQMTNCSERGIFIIAASNRPEKIDPAIMRTGRIDRVIYLPPPDFEARKQMFELYLKNRPIDFSVDYDILAKLTENFVSSDIKFIVDEASREALKIRSKITQQIIVDVINKNPPSISFSEIKKYELLKDQLDTSKKSQPNDVSKERKIGFKTGEED